MSTPPSTPNPNPTPAVHGGRPDGGMHVESAAAKGGGYDFSGAVGSNIVPAPASVAQSASPEVLDAPPWTSVNPTVERFNPPLT